MHKGKNRRLIETTSKILFFRENEQKFAYDCRFVLTEIVKAKGTCCSFEMPKVFY